VDVASLPPALLARVVRSGLEESVHVGHVAVCDAQGRILSAAGDPGHVVFVRSCMKPVQAAVSLAASGMAASVDDRQVAIMCASHNGEPVHLRAVRSVLRLGGLGAGDLRTPPARPIDAEAAARVRAAAPIFHNCSGKHAGMLLASARAGWSIERYRSPSHPLQRRVLTAVKSLSGIERPLIGVDGCGVPVHGMPLAAVATMYARLGSEDHHTGLKPALGGAVAAMRRHPYLVGGRDRADTAIMQATPNVLVKEGAEALLCASILDAGIGVAVKVADGGERAAAPALLRVLEALGQLDGRARRSLAAWRRPAVLGGGRSVGQVEAIVELRSV
jgi:L-asparaginase II